MIAIWKSQRKWYILSENRYGMNEDFGNWKDEKDDVLFEVSNPGEDYSFDHSGVDSGENDDTYDNEIGELRLGFVKFVGTESGGINIYEIIFTAFIDEFWGEGFNYQPAALCNNLEPQQRYISKVVKIRTIIRLNTICDSGCFSMQDCMDGCVCLAYENLQGYEEYPDYRLVLNFGETYDEVEHKFAEKRIFLN